MHALHSTRSVPECRPQDRRREDEEQQRPDDQGRNKALALALEAREKLGEVGLQPERGSTGAMATSPFTNP